ncbi:SMP-30/gluconolactonase/LRE family protein [Hymenobacter caeli]|uniref:Sugar lactone lactonase YvrE n=1 Tax=Hymenobacter caeli TaxID=2735894 RepID=A0ABX2FTW8_9BACT|nr:SMP-30/gluconolactonase/LRE family protein [Hymenobacter caeli]NRT20640.1 sugar lactone lactonase YvrE [Hymenobacter caeli]
MPTFFSSSPGFTARRLAPLAAALALAACSKNDIAIAPPAVPDAVVFTVPGLYPEGLQYDATGGRFLVGSQTAGALGAVADDGTYSVFADDASLVSTIGLYFDAPRNRVLVAVSDPGYNKQRTTAATLRKLARLAIFNRDNGQLVRTVDLGGLRPNYATHFANDAAVDGQGNIYVTDSFAPLIYKIDAQGTATVFLEDARLAAPAGAFGLNGIVYHPDGYLLVAKSDAGALYKVPLSNPAGFTVVNTTGLNLSAIDGLRLQDNNTLQAVTNAQAKVYRLTSADGWATATLGGTFATPPQYPTSIALRPGADGYVLYSNLNALQANAQPPVSQFTIARLRFQ